MAALGWLLNLGFGGSGTSTPPAPDGLAAVYNVPASGRLYNVPASGRVFTIPSGSTRVASKAPEKIIVDPDADQVVVWVFSGDDFDSGANTTGTPTVTEVGSSDLTITALAAPGTDRKASAHIDGGTANTTYLLKCVIDDNFSTPSTHVGYGEYHVDASET